MDVRVQADAVAVGRALIAALLFVGKRAASFSEAKFDDSVFRSVLRRRWTHWTFCDRNFGVYSGKSDWECDYEHEPNSTGSSTFLSYPADSAKRLSGRLPVIKLLVEAAPATTLGTVEHLRENVAGAGLQLPDDAIKELDDIAG
jgi:hypothetical protein